MEWISDLLGIGANVASGGLFGLVGSLIGVGAKYLQAKQVAKAKAAEWEHEIKLRELTMEQGDRETENEIAIASSEGAWKGLSASYQTTIPSSSVHMWVNDIRALFRPLLTIALWVMTLVTLRWMINGTVQQWMLEAESFAPMVKYTIDSITFSASTATVWWFGDRAMTPPGAKAR
jgi:hypothetical protein